VSDQADVVVVGGGQAGLAAGYFLSRTGLSCVIIDGGARVGESWRRRWDSLRLFTVARYSSLPGSPFPGDPEHFPGKDEVADYLEAYARTWALPVRHNSRVTSLERVDGRYRLDTNSGVYEARQVIVATGAYQQPYVPSIATRLNDGVVQLHSADYHNPAQIHSDDVLVVGAANSGAGIAEDLSHRHHVWLSHGKRIRHMPRRLLGKSLHWWGDHLGLIDAPLDSWRGRTQRNDVLVGPSLRALARERGIELVGRVVDAHHCSIRFEDGPELAVETVVWATGFRSDYSWIRPAVFDEDGRPVHRRGVTDLDGLYFLGMQNQYSRGSSLIFWVKEDAEYIVDRVRERASNVGSR
jgi:putative flavoprotein involved in K+ transport